MKNRTSVLVIGVGILCVSIHLSGMPGYDASGEIRRNIQHELDVAGKADEYREDNILLSAIYTNNPDRVGVVLVFEQFGCDEHIGEAFVLIARIINPEHYVEYSETFKQKKSYKEYVEHCYMIFNWILQRARYLRDAERGAVPINHKDEFGRTALHWAVMANSLAMVRKLVEADANIHATDSDWKTPFNRALDRNETDKRIVDYFEEINASVAI